MRDAGYFPTRPFHIFGTVAVVPWEELPAGEERSAGPALASLRLDADGRLSRACFFFCRQK